MSPTYKDVIQQVGQIGFGGPSYRKVYRQYRAGARDVLEHDALPAPVKYYVERYLDAIRPED